MAQANSAPRLAALRYRDFRLLWGGQLVSSIGSQMEMIAVNWHVFTLLKGQVFELDLFGQPVTLNAEALALGTLGLVRVGPVILFALLGGLLADAFDRRKVMIFTQAALAVFSGILALITLSGGATVLAIYALTALSAAMDAFDEPARQALIPNLLPRQHFANAMSLITILFYFGTILGPIFSTAIIAGVGVGYVYLINAVSFGAVIISVLMLRYRDSGPHAGGAARGLGWKALVEGVRFTYSMKLIWSTMLLDFFATFFGSVRTMLPIVAESILGLGALGYGILATAQPVGAVIAGALLALRSREIGRQGVALLVSVALYGLATALFGLTTSFVLGYVLFSLTGAGDTVSTVIRGTIRQLMTPDRLRGRMVSVNMVFFMGGPQLGELQAGAVAAAFGVPAAIITGGLATLLITAWIAWRYPSLRRYTNESAAVMLS